MRISSRACSMIFSSVVASQVTRRSMKSKRRMHGLSPLAPTLGPSPGSFPQASTKAGSAFGSSGSSTREAKITARVVASGLRDHQRCSVDGWPWWMDFSLALAALMASRGKATSISFLAAGIILSIAEVSVALNGNAALALHTGSTAPKMGVVRMATARVLYLFS